MAIWRATHPHKDKLKAHLNKPFGGANATLVAVNDLPGEVQDIATRAANCMNREVTGIDILQDKKTGAWYVLEVNNAPQLRSGAFISKKTEIIAKFFDKEVV